MYLSINANTKMEMARKTNIYFRKCNLIYRFPSGIKTLPVDQIFQSR